jgi:hypothetical protein
MFGIIIIIINIIIIIIISVYYYYYLLINYFLTCNCISLGSSISYTNTDIYSKYT